MQSCFQPATTWRFRYAATNRQPEAIQLWRENLRAISRPFAVAVEELWPKLAHRIEFDHAGAIRSRYRAVLAIKPDYPAARVALAQELSKAGDAAGAMKELGSVLNADAKNVAALELTGDIEKSRGRNNEARQAYSSALTATSDRDVRSRIRAKLKATS